MYQKNIFRVLLGSLLVCLPGVATSATMNGRETVLSAQAVQVSWFEISGLTPGLKIINSMKEIEALEHSSQAIKCNKAELPEHECTETHVIQDALKEAKKMVNFQKESAILITLGERPDDSFRLKLISVSQKQETLRVKVSESGRCGEVMTFVPTSPALLIVVPKLKSPFKPVLDLEIPLDCEGEI
jgi:hypothetical protein